MKSVMIIGEFSPAEMQKVENYVKYLPERIKPYVFVRKWGEIWWKVNA